MKTSLILPAVYVSAIVAANFSVSFFGPAVTPLNAFFLIGLDFVVRDKLHEKIGLWKMMVLVLIAGAITYIVNPSVQMIAIASSLAFALSSTADTVVYQALIKRKWHVKSNASNIAGAAVDSFSFPMIAFGAFMPWVILGQFFAKVFGGFVWSLMLKGVK